MRPNYYKDSNGRDLWDHMIELQLDFFQSNILKYIYRYKGKNGIEDLKKARQYLDKLIEVEENKKNG